MQSDIIISFPFLQMPTVYETSRESYGDSKKVWFYVEESVGMAVHFCGFL